MQSREQISELINQFLASASSENRFFGNDELLNQIKSAHQDLNEIDKEHIKNHIDSKHKEKLLVLYPPEQKTQRRHEFLKETLTGAALGMAGGVAGAGIYSLIKGTTFFISKPLTALTTAAGAFYYPALMHPEDIQKAKETERVFNRIRSELDIGGNFYKYQHYVSRRNEECQEALHHELRRRRI